MSGSFPFITHILLPDTALNGSAIKHKERHSTYLPIRNRKCGEMKNMALPMTVKMSSYMPYRCYIMTVML